MQAAAPCPFCSLPQDRLLRATQLGVAARDIYPVSRGHTLIIPKRHIRSFFDATAAERGELMELLQWAREGLLAAERPDGFNVGINDGDAAGQSVPHLHIHLIPRYRGDRPDPRGGVRWVLPDKADYWSKR